MIAPSPLGARAGLAFEDLDRAPMRSWSVRMPTSLSPSATGSARIVLNKVRAASMSGVSGRAVTRFWIMIRLTCVPSITAVNSSCVSESRRLGALEVALGQGVPRASPAADTTGTRRILRKASSERLHEALPGERVMGFRVMTSRTLRPKGAVNGTSGCFISDHAVHRPG